MLNIRCKLVLEFLVQLEYVHQPWYMYALQVTLGEGPHICTGLDHGLPQANTLVNITAHQVSFPWLVSGGED